MNPSYPEFGSAEIKAPNIVRRKNLFDGLLSNNLPLYDGLLPKTEIRNLDRKVLQLEHQLKKITKRIDNYFVVEDELIDEDEEVLTRSPAISQPPSIIQQNLNKLSPEALSTPEPSIKVYNTAGEFFNRRDSVHCIEVLQSSRQLKRGVSRLVGGAPISSGQIGTTVLPSRIRIRCPYMLEVLENITNTTFSPKAYSYAPDLSIASLVFLYPFKLFIRYHADILTFLDREDGHSKLDYYKPSGRDENQRTQISLLMVLFEEYLSPLFKIRYELRNHKRTTLLFEHLWLLFDIGDVCYVREPDEAFPDIHRLWRVTQYGGGRELLNGNESVTTDPHLLTSLPKGMSKGKESSFYVRGFYLDTDGKKIVIEDSCFTIPRWEGERHIHELKIFPYEYCQPGRDFHPEKTRDDWIVRLAKEGECYAKLRAGEVKHLKGIGLDEKSRKAEYRSDVIIDQSQAGLEAPGLSLGPSEKELKKITNFMNVLRPYSSTSLVIYQGDAREVEELPERVSAECHGFSVSDTIHDDNSLEYEIFKSRLENIRPPLLDTLRSPPSGVEVSKENYMLFPRIVKGFVLSARKWVNFEISAMQDAIFDRSLWTELQLPRGYKRALLATVRSHLRARDTSVQSDSVPGKGAGVIIHLQGPSGIGKTFTAEALAAFTKRPLYRITSGELGSTVSQIETHLAEILDRGQRWGCVILLDEADTYLAKRGSDTFERNAIVSAFLRQLEWYPGIMILTSNRSLDFDGAVAQRIHLQLFYPHLNSAAASKVWAIYCTEEKCQQLVAERGSRKPKVEIQPEVHTWWERHYNATTHDREEQEAQPWWSGRRIQFAFREATALAVFDRLVEKQKEGESKVNEIASTLLNLKKDLKKSKGNQTKSASLKEEKRRLNSLIPEVKNASHIIDDNDTIVIKTEHFDEILARSQAFIKGLSTFHDLDTSNSTDYPPDEKVEYIDGEATEAYIDSSSSESDVDSEFSFE